MIFYSREKKTLIIPEGIGSTSTQDYENGVTAGKAIQKAEDDAKITPRINITENGVYEADYGYNTVSVNVPSGGDCQEEIEEAYESGQTVGYNSGYTAGEAAQKSKLAITAITANGTYEREDGFNRVTVNVESAPQLEVRSYNLDENWSGDSGEVYPDASLGFDGFRYFMVNDIGYGQAKVNSGFTAARNLMSSTTITENGTYTNESGWSAVTVNVPPTDCSTAYAEGVAYQKSKLASTAITQNGTFTRADGWSAVTVNVPTTGGCSLQQKTFVLQDGMNYSNVLINPSAGYDGMSQVVLNADAAVDYGKYLQKSQLVSTAITQNGTVTRADGFNSVNVNVKPSLTVGAMWSLWGMMELANDFQYGVGTGNTLIRLFEGPDGEYVKIVGIPDGDNTKTMSEYEMCYDGTLLPAGTYGFQVFIEMVITNGVVTSPFIFHSLNSDVKLKDINWEISTIIL